MKNFAVVKFLSDCTYSEIPTVWLSKEGDVQKCWWPPRTANCANLIANCASPNIDTWTNHKVEIIKYCSSLESARKSASDANYYTTDEERLGRGKRSHIPSSRYSSSEEEDEEAQPRNSKTKKKNFCSSAITSFTIPSCPDNLGYNNNILCNISEKSYDNSSSKELQTSHQEKYVCSNKSSVPSCSINFGLNNDTSDNIPSKSCESHSKNKETSSQQVTKRKNKETVDIENLPIIFEGYIPGDTNENGNIKQSVDKMLRMQAATNLTLREISQNIKKLENVIKKSTKFNLETNDVLIAEFLPLNTVERIKEFESLLKNTEEAVTQFKEYILKAGENSPKANIQRILGKIFTNECAMNCSMKGIRNNFRVGDLYLMKIIRRELTLRYAHLTESEFDNVVAEWLRFAKQRKERDGKKEKEIQQNRGNEEHLVQHTNLS